MKCKLSLLVTVSLLCAVCPAVFAAVGDPPIRDQIISGNLDGIVNDCLNSTSSSTHQDCIEREINEAMKQNRWLDAIEINWIASHTVYPISDRKVWKTKLEALKESIRKKTGCRCMSRPQQQQHQDKICVFKPTFQCKESVTNQLIRDGHLDKALGIMTNTRPSNPHRIAYWKSKANTLRMHMDNLANNRTLPTMTFAPVDIRTNLSLKEFFDEYVSKMKPVVMTDVNDKMGLEVFTLKNLREMCADMVVTPLEDANKTVNQWAGLRPTKKMTLGEFIDGLNSTTSQLYVHDQSLEAGCPQTLKNLTMPKYFCNDYLQRFPLYETEDGRTEWLLGRERQWPSLFIGPNGTRSHLHKDSLRTHFWMAMLQGTKQWTIFLEDQEPILGTKGILFETDASNPDYERFPLSRYASGYRHALKAGEMMYIPGASPHQVENLEFTMAMTGNYVDIYNINMTLQDIEEKKKTSYHTANRAIIHAILTHPKMDKYMDLTLDNMPWQEFTQIANDAHQRWIREAPGIFDEIAAIQDDYLPISSEDDGDK